MKQHKKNYFIPLTHKWKSVLHPCNSCINLSNTGNSVANRMAPGFGLEKNVREIPECRKKRIYAPVVDTSPPATEHCHCFRVWTSEESLTLDTHLGGRQPNNTGKSKQHTLSCWSHLLLRPFLCLGDPWGGWDLRRVPMQSPATIPFVNLLWTPNGVWGLLENPVPLHFGKKVSTLFARSLVQYVVLLWLWQILETHDLLGTVAAYTSS